MGHAPGAGESRAGRRGGGDQFVALPLATGEQLVAAAGCFQRGACHDRPAKAARSRSSSRNVASKAAGRFFHADFAMKASAAAIDAYAANTPAAAATRCESQKTTITTTPMNAKAMSDSTTATKVVSIAASVASR